MIVVDKEEILDFPSRETYGASDFIYDCICKCGLDDREDEAFELAQMIIKAYQNVIKTATEYEVDVSVRF